MKPGMSKIDFGECARLQAGGVNTPERAASSKPIGFSRQSGNRRSETAERTAPNAGTGPAFATFGTCVALTMTGVLRICAPAPLHPARGIDN
jgi:hypothetical protein